MTEQDAVLKCDWDGRAPTVPWLWRRLQRAGYRIVAMGMRRSPSGRGWHGWIYVSPRPWSRAEIVALQLLCRSDPKREARNLYRSRRMRGQPARMRTWWNVLYQPEEGTCRNRE